MFNPAPKPKHKRLKPKRGQHTKITKKAREEVYRRSGKRCECCGKSQCYAFEVAHLTNASAGGSGGNVSNLILACGPKVNSGTCHHWMDSTSKGREWKQEKKIELEQYYDNL